MTNPEILIVDDIPGNLNFVSDILYNEGFRIIVATNGQDAIDITREKHPDLILLDVAMPLMDGYEVCRILKEDDSTREIPIIFLTAKGENEDILKGFEAGAVDYISKPFNTSELVSRVNTHIELRRQSDELKHLNQILEEKVIERTVQLQTLNDNLTIANKNLSKAYKELSNLDKAKNEFIRHINHELRTPLQGIHGFVRILSEIVENPEEKEYIRSIDFLVKRLVKLSELSLLFTEVRTENYQLRQERVSLSDCINEALQNFEKQERDIQIKVGPVPEDLFILADKKLICACIGIVLDNAIKFSPDNGIVEIRASGDNSRIRLEVADNGPGYSEKAREHLFDLLSADNIDEEFYGFGIGLATAKIILDLMDASIEIQNKTKGGALTRLVFSTA
ncbi:MAG: hybrid sensor histidine kinase/response regulator [Bacteroidales bacterium]|nr:hybrid sensor histidine kinase/response regulator [Bacteroidales bacterium]